ncbi:uncharacterized protein LOC111276943 isoform X8 [Durio zibethinus]|uniref:Uncharacterized protein LOC111276943 isoform X8 n=1 Tax=Durio zibethinus TaxID=66656 RepID=A0A6P5WSM1_DURZI|nr:uncharacterized protein LOC111276943 isoform X8 [Durio zibethinus]
MDQENKMSEHSTHGVNSDGVQAQSSDFLKRHSSETRLAPSKLKEDRNFDFQDSEAKELSLRASAQKEEIQHLREQIAVACVKELQLLNEKCALERKFSDLRMAIDEKQKESITSASNELALRKGDLEENLKLTHDLKHLHDQLQWKIRTSHASHGFSPNNHYTDEQHLLPPGNMLRYMHDNDHTAKNLIFNDQGQQRLSNGNSQGFLFNSDRGVADPNPDSAFDKSFVRIGAEDMTNNVLYQRDEMASDASEEGPGIEGFQIIGDATPGEKLLGCGFPVRGTTLCMFQWVRHLQDGTRQYIEGATNPEYVVTADDVDKLIAVECIPMDDQGHQGELVRLFANDQNKIKCDPDMQNEIDTCISRGQATFSVLLLVGSTTALPKLYRILFSFMISFSLMYLFLRMMPNSFYFSRKIVLGEFK